MILPYGDSLRLVAGAAIPSPGFRRADRFWGGFRCPAQKCYPSRCGVCVTVTSLSCGLRQFLNFSPCGDQSRRTAGLRRQGYIVAVPAGKPLHDYKVYKCIPYLCRYSGSVMTCRRGGIACGRPALRSAVICFPCRNGGSVRAHRRGDESYAAALLFVRQ